MPSLIMKNGVLRYRASVPVPGESWEKETKALSGRQQKIIQKRSTVGGKNKETVGGGNGARSRHGVF